MQVVLAGSFAFNIIDRLSGGTLGVDAPDWFNGWLTDFILQVPFLFWALNMSWLFLVGITLSRLMGHLAKQALGALTVRVKLNVKINHEAFAKYLSTKKIKVCRAFVIDLLVCVHDFFNRISSYR